MRFRASRAIVFSADSIMPRVRGGRTATHMLKALLPAHCINPRANGSDQEPSDCARGDAATAIILDSWRPVSAAHSKLECSLPRRSTALNTLGHKDR
jgi:hypothetical protein